MPASIFAGLKVKTLKDTLTLNGKSDIISSTVDPTASAVDAPIGSLLINQTSGKLYRKLDAGSSVNWEEVGSGTGGINYILNPSAEVNTTGWSTYADAAGTAPVDGSGGSPNVTWTRSTTSPLRGVADFNFAKDAANRQGQGVSVDFTIDEADKAKVLSVTFDYEVLSGTYADADLTVYLIADPTGTPVVIQPAGYTVQAATVGTTMRKIATFQTQATGLSYRLCFHVASTSASAYTLAVDNVVVGPQSTVQGAAVSDWVSFTPTGSWAANTTYTGRWKRVGDSVQVQASLSLTGAPTATRLTINLPSGLVIDNTKRSGGASATINNIFGTGKTFDGATAVHNLTVAYESTTAVAVSYESTATAQLNNVTNTSPFTYNSGDVLDIEYTVPISGWSSNTVLSQDTDTRVVAASFSVTGSHTSSGSFQAIPSLTVRGDTHGMISGTTVTIPVSGWYDFSGNIGFIGNPTGIRDVQIAFSPLPSGVPFSPTTHFSSPQVALSGGQTHVGVGGAIYINAGTQITFNAYQNCGGNLAYGDNLLTIKRLSGPATIAASETVAARYKTSAGNSITDAAVNYLDFVDKEYDTHGMVSIASPAGNKLVQGTGWKATIPISGKYHISAQILSQSGASWNSAEIWEIIIIKNGAQIAVNGSYSQATHTTLMPAAISSIISLNAGDIIEIAGYQNSGASINMFANGKNNFVQIYRVGN